MRAGLVCARARIALFTPKPGGRVSAQAPICADIRRHPRSSGGICRNPPSRDGAQTLLFRAVAAGLIRTYKQEVTGSSPVPPTREEPTICRAFLAAELAGGHPRVGQSQLRGPERGPR